MYESLDASADASASAREIKGKRVTLSVLS